MRKVIAVATISIAALGFASPAAAFEGGGRKPSEAPLISWGQHYTGQLNNRKEDANYSGFEEVALWRLPPVSTHDEVVVNWHGLPFTHESGFPVCMVLAQGINDYNWGSVYESTSSNGNCYDESSVIYRLSGSGTASTPITIQNSDSASTYLEFFARASSTEPAKYETFPYDFSVEAPRHFLSLNFPSVTKVPTNGTLHAADTEAIGLPGPDGLVYTLTANWRDNGVAITTAPSLGGQIAFPLALPESAIGQRVRFIVSRAPDAEYQAVESPAIKAQVTKPAESPACKKARAHARTIARQLKRLKRHARFARGITRRRLHHRARHVRRELRVARTKGNAACS